MKPKQKAIELVERFSKFSFKGNIINFPNSIAKTCAIFSVEQILGFNVFWASTELVKESPETYTEEDTVEFWEAVLEELKQLEFDFGSSLLTRNQQSISVSKLGNATVAKIEYSRLPEIAQAKPMRKFSRLLQYDGTNLFQWHTSSDAISWHPQGDIFIISDPNMVIENIIEE